MGIMNGHYDAHSGLSTRMPVCQKYKWWLNPVCQWTL